MQIFHLYHDQSFGAEIHRDFWHFEVSVWLHTVARSLIALFIPILLLELGYDISAVIWYYVALNVVNIPMNFVAERLTMRFGAKRIIITATLVSIAYFWLLGAAGGGLVIAGWGVLLLLAALDGIYDSFYYVSHIYLFLRSSSGNASRDTGILASIRTFGSMCGPLIGALIFISGSRTTLFGASIIFFALSILPLLQLRHTENRPLKARTSTSKILSHSEDRRNFTSLALRSMHNVAEGVLWPLFIYSLFATDRSVAWIAIIVSLSKVIFSYLTGTIRRKNRMPTIAIGGGLIGLVWVLRLFVDGQSFYYASIVLLGFFALLVDIPNDSNIFERGRRGDSLRYSTLRNAISMSGQLVFFLILAFLTNIFQGSFIIAALAGFAIAAIAGAVLAGRKKSL